MTSLKLTALPVVLASACLCAAAGQAQPAGNAGELKVYLPRAQQVSAKDISVGQVCIVFGQDAQRVAAAEKVQLSRAPLSREQMRVDRAMILGRLAACGFAGRDIRFSGSQEVIVTLNEQEIDASRLVAAAAAMLNEKSPPAGEAQWWLSGEVEPIIIPSGPVVKLAAALVTAAEDRATVRVDIVADGKTRAGRDLTFTKAYLWRQVVARKDIAAGQAVTEAEASVETMYRPRPQQGWASPYGKTATRAVPAGAVIAQDLLAAPRPAVVFERNATVRVRVDLGGYAIMVKAVALSAGRVGETVPVQNIDSKRILTARVCPDGTVEPLLEENAK